MDDDGDVDDIIIIIIIIIIITITNREKQQKSIVDSLMVLYIDKYLESSENIILLGY